MNDDFDDFEIGDVAVSIVCGLLTSLLLTFAFDAPLWAALGFGMAEASEVHTRWLVRRGLR